MIYGHRESKADVTMAVTPVRAEADGPSRHRQSDDDSLRARVDRETADRQKT